jgi:hypothetical protein
VGKKKKGKKGKPLTGLAAALVKAGVMEEKSAKKVQREQRREHKALGEEGVATKKAEEQAATQAREREQAQAAADARLAAEQDGVFALISENARPGWQGRRRWFFIRNDGQVDFLDVSDEVTRLLRDGAAAVVEATAGGKALVVHGAEVLGKIALAARGRILFWNKLAEPA